MTAEHSAANVESWRVIEAFVDGMPAGAHWTAGKVLAGDFSMRA